MAPRAAQSDDPDHLRSLTLGELGADVEFSVHNWAHMRWSTRPAAFRPDAPATNPTAVAPRWDRVGYDWLGDSYSAHVHPVFWKIHGWVDDHLDDAERVSSCGAEVAAAWDLDRADGSFEGRFRLRVDEHGRPDREQGLRVRLRRKAGWPLAAADLGGGDSGDPDPLVVAVDAPAEVERDDDGVSVDDAHHGRRHRPRPFRHARTLRR